MYDNSKTQIKLRNTIIFTMFVLIVLLSIGLIASLIHNNFNNGAKDLLAVGANPEQEEFLNLPYAKFDLLSRYKAYQAKCHCSDEEVVTMVNIGLDRDFYIEPTEVSELNETMLVNKFRYLPSDYEPYLARIDDEFSDGGAQYAVVEAANAFEKMASDMKRAGLHIVTISTYRDYGEQEEIYQDYVDKLGPDGAKEFAALPGYSEHQTGYAFDISSPSNPYFEKTEERKWLEKHAHEYGFILRYPEEKEKITGYSNEPWHYRYLGEDLAKSVKESGLTYDEYYVRNLDY